MGWKPGQGVGPRLTKKEKTKAKQQNVKMKVYGCYMPSQQEKDETSDSNNSDDEYSEITFAPDDDEPFRANPKDNFFGIGYSGLDKRPVLSGHINLFEPQTFNLQEKNKKFSIRGQAFGVGAFEVDDEDIYAREDISRYDFTLGPEKKTKSRWNRNQATNSSKNGCLESFVAAKNPIDHRKFFKPPDLPKDFKPIHVMRKSRFFPPIEPYLRSKLENERQIYGGQNLNAETRASIIGEPSVSGKSQLELNEELPVKESENSSVVSKIIIRTLNLHGIEQTAERQKLEKEKKIAAVASSSWMDKLYTSSFVKGGIEGSGLNVEGSLQNLESFIEKTTENETVESDKQIPGTSSSTFGSSSNFAKPFIADPDKQRRFEQYLVLRKNRETSEFANIQPLSMTEWTRNQESTEFEQAARLFNSFLHSSENKFVGSKTSISSEQEGVVDQMKEAAKNKMYGKLTRERTIWQPFSLVCKRFNVAEPRVCYAVETEKKKKFSVFDSLDFYSSVSKFQTAINLQEKEFRPSQNESWVEENDLKENITTKENNFEAFYEKVFGKGIEELESSKMESSHDSESEANASLEVKAKEKAEEKRDLFKAIFLSSSEDSDSEPEESVDSEVVKSVLIGKTPAEINVQRNRSPPRGIFAKLDLDSLMAAVCPSEQNTEESGVSATKPETEKETAGIESEVSREVLPPDVYGPLPPSRKSKTDHAASKEVQKSPKPIFKSVVVPKIEGDQDEVKGIWMERTKVKKSKKEKRKHKHKDEDRERSKHKKSKKRKR